MSGLPLEQPGDVATQTKRSSSWFVRKPFEISNPTEEILLDLREQGNRALFSGQYEMAKAAYERGIENAKKLDHQIALASFLNNLAIVMERLERPNEALELLAESFEISYRLQHHEGINNSLSNASMIYASYQQFDQALINLEFSHALALHQNRLEDVAWAEEMIKEVQTYLKQVSFAIDTSNEHEE